MLNKKIPAWKPKTCLENQPWEHLILLGMTSALILRPQKEKQFQNSKSTKLQVTETEESFEMQAVMHQQEEHQLILEVTEVNWPP